MTTTDNIAGTVSVLMATRDGARHLGAQLASIAGQDWPRIDVLVSDDGSSDATLAVLSEGAAGWRKGRFEVVSGPQQGFAENFRSLLLREVTGDFVAFSDQDDIWLREKLRVATEALAGDGPALYCGRTLLVDEDDNEIGLSPLFRRPPAFANALVQSIAGANTMVMNRAGFQLVQTAAERAPFVSHDWFCYQIISGAGGRVIYDPVPQVRYRQHGGNLVGANTGWRARIDRLRHAWGGRFVAWNAQNLETLHAAEDLMTPLAKQQTNEFELARGGPLLARLGHLRRSGVWRQTIAGQVSLWAAATLGKL